MYMHMSALTMMLTEQRQVGMKGGGGGGREEGRDGYVHACLHNV